MRQAMQASGARSKSDGSAANLPKLFSARDFLHNVERLGLEAA